VTHNTGGWVVDSVEPEPVKGAAITLISDELEVVDICVYRQQAGTRPPRVTVMAVPGAPDEPTPLRDWLVAELDARPDPWARTATVAAETVHERRHQLEARVRLGTEAACATAATGPLGW